MALYPSEIAENCGLNFCHWCLVDSIHWMLDYFKAQKWILAFKLEKPSLLHKRKILTDTPDSA